MKLLALFSTALLALTATSLTTIEAKRGSSKLKVHVSIHHLKKANTTTPAPSATKSNKNQSSAATNNSSTKAATDDGSWHMAPVTSIQARVQGDAPTWDETNKRLVSSYGSDFDAKYMSALDTVNFASVEGALMYVQAEGINVDEQSVKCERKNKMQYVVFYELTIVQPNNSLAFYEQPDHTAPTPEYCPFVAMDSGKCTPAGEDIPDTCKQFDGLDGQLPLGHCVGAEKKDTDKRAPYPDTYWFSYPNSCPTKTWKDKTSECRQEQAGGLCPLGVQPDGVTCTYSYEILGYVNIDDVVGITSLKNSKTKMPYGNYTEFCNDGGVEFSATNNGGEFTVKESLPFWENPGDADANAERFETMVQVYNDNVAKGTGAAATLKDKLKPLPSVDELTKQNPECYENSKQCATAKFGCKRTLYAQLCQVCDKADASCVTAPSDFKFVELTLPTAESSSGSDDSTDGSKTKAVATKNTKKNKDSDKKDAKTEDTSGATTSALSSMVGLVLTVALLLLW